MKLKKIFFLPKKNLSLLAWSFDVFEEKYILFKRFKLCKHDLSKIKSGQILII